LTFLRTRVLAFAMDSFLVKRQPRG
jgi:hypothetical protein